MLLAAFVGWILAAGGSAYLLLALYHLLRFRPHPAASDFHPPATLLVPAHGVPPRLEECLDTICDQDYPVYQVVFGLHAPDDPARPVIERIMARYPAIDMTLVIDSRRIGANPKNANLANMLPAAKHDLLVMVDSDILVDRDFLATVVQPLAKPKAGGVTCVYKASPQPGLASRLGALFINDWVMPSALVDVALHGVQVCYGAAIAVTRQSLEAIGGFDAMADAVAQDYVFGYQLRRHGYELHLASTVVETVVAEPGLEALVRHELRWNRAVRAVRPVDHALSIFLNPLLPSALLLFLSQPVRLAVTAVIVQLALRLSLHGLLRQRLRLPPVEPWLVPIREILNFSIWSTAFLGRRVQWGSAVMQTGGGLSMQLAESHEGDKSRRTS